MTVHRSPTAPLVIALAAAVLVLAGCGDDDDATEPSAPRAGALSEACPSPIVVQTDWWPEAEHGSLYQLLGEGYTVDADQKSVRGPLVAGGEDTGVDLEIRAGGPAIGTAVAATMYTDDDVTLGYATTEGQVFRFAEAPMLSVVAPLEINPQMIMWDPATYPEVESIADLGEKGTIVQVFENGRFADVLVVMGLLQEDQIDRSYNGLPARFVAEQGRIAQQGFASAEPYTYEHDIEEWGRPIAFQTLHDAGFQPYSQTLGIRPADKQALAPCLERLVPMVQQAAIDYLGAPETANAVIVDVVEQFDAEWQYSAGLAAYSAAAQRDLGLIGSGPDTTLGNIDEARIAAVLQLLRDADLDVPDDLQPSDLFTNEFVDPSIGL
jgi:hypothetical protein